MLDILRVEDCHAGSNEILKTVRAIVPVALLPNGRSRMCHFV